MNGRRRHESGDEQSAAKSYVGLILKVSGLIATVAVTVVITRIARRALNRRINPSVEQKGIP